MSWRRRVVRSPHDHDLASADLIDGDLDLDAALVHSRGGVGERHQGRGAASDSTHD
jgi:hypothetical protein